MRFRWLALLLAALPFYAQQVQLSTEKRLTLSAARLIADTIEAEAKKNNWLVTFVVMDAGGGDRRSEGARPDVCEREDERFRLATILVRLDGVLAAGPTRGDGELVQREAPRVRDVDEDGVRTDEQAALDVVADEVVHVPEGAGRDAEGGDRAWPRVTRGLRGREEVDLRSAARRDRRARRLQVELGDEKEGRIDALEHAGHVHRLARVVGHVACDTHELVATEIDVRRRGRVGGPRDAEARADRHERV